MNVILELVGNFIKKYVKPFFFAKDCPDRIRPIKVVITIFLALIIVSVIIKLFNPEYLSDMFILGMCGQLGILIGADVWRNNTKTKTKTNGYS